MGPLCSEGSAYSTGFGSVWGWEQLSDKEEFQEIQFQCLALRRPCSPEPATPPALAWVPSLRQVQLDPATLCHLFGSLF